MQLAVLKAQINRYGKIQQWISNQNNAKKTNGKARSSPQQNISTGSSQQSVVTSPHIDLMKNMGSTFNFNTTQKPTNISQTSNNTQVLVANNPIRVMQSANNNRRDVSNNTNEQAQKNSTTPYQISCTSNVKRYGTASYYTALSNAQSTSGNTSHSPSHPTFGSTVNLQPHCTNVDTSRFIPSNVQNQQRSNYNGALCNIDKRQYSKTLSSDSGGMMTMNQIPYRAPKICTNTQQQAVNMHQYLILNNPRMTTSNISPTSNIPVNIGVNNSSHDPAILPSYPRILSSCNQSVVNESRLPNSSISNSESSSNGLSPANKHGIETILADECTQRKRQRLNVPETETSPSPSLGGSYNFENIFPTPPRSNASSHVSPVPTDFSSGISEETIENEVPDTSTVPLPECSEQIDEKPPVSLLSAFVRDEEIIDLTWLDDEVFKQEPMDNDDATVSKFFSNSIRKSITSINFRVQD